MKVFVDDRGSALPLFGGLVFVAFMVIAVAIEVSMLGVTYRDVAAAADAGAEAGAAMVVHPGAATTGFTLDPVDAPAVAEATALAVRPSGSVDVRSEASRLCVTVVDRYRPRTLALLGVESVPVSVTTCASPASG